MTSKQLFNNLLSYETNYIDKSVLYSQFNEYKNTELFQVLIELKRTTFSKKQIKYVMNSPYLLRKIKEKYLNDDISYIVDDINNLKLDDTPNNNIISSVKIDNISNSKITSSNIKSQRKTNNLGFNTSNTQEESYNQIEADYATSKCTDSNHIGDRILPIRKFYLNKGGKKLQGACIICQKNRRANRIKLARDKFQVMTKHDICDYYIQTYGLTKVCSNCKLPKSPIHFPISISMECGLHNHCINCSNRKSQGNGGLRDFIFMPDKDNLKYQKKNRCEKCNGTYKLAIDHILPISKGGSDCILNKQTLCIHCNSKKNDTIDCAIKPEFICERYKDDTLDYTDNINLTLILSKKVYDFKKVHIYDASLELISNSIKEYKKKYNLGHNLDRIIQKISIIKYSSNNQ
jgi:hypothetical protein